MVGASVAVGVAVTAMTEVVAAGTSLNVGVYEPYGVVAMLGAVCVV